MDFMSCTIQCVSTGCLLKSELSFKWTIVQEGKIHPWLLDATMCKVWTNLHYYQKPKKFVTERRRKNPLVFLSKVDKTLKGVDFL